MSLDLDGVIAESARLGSLAYLATVSASGTPYLSPVTVAWSRRRLLAFVASDEAKVANVRVHPAMAVHWAVSEATGMDSLIVWGRGEVIADTDRRRQRWDQMGYDLDRFEPGGPEADTHVFLELIPTKAVLWRAYGTAGRQTWRALT